MTHRLKIILLSTVTLLLLAACQQQSDTEPTTSERSAEVTADTRQQTASSEQSSPPADPSAAEAAGLAENCDLIMGYDLWAPYHFEAPDGTVMGVEIDLIRDLMSAHDCNISFVRDDWVNLLEMIKRGEIDVVPGATAVAGREDYAWFSIPYRQEQFEVFVRQGASLPSRNLIELAAAGMKIGLTDGYFYGQLVDLAQTQHADAFVYSSIAESTVLKLIDGNVSLIVEDPYVVNMILHQKDWHDEIARAGIVVANTPVSFMFSKKTTSGRQLLDFNMRLADFLASQRDEEILSSYLSDL